MFSRGKCTKKDIHVICKLLQEGISVPKIRELTAIIIDDVVIRFPSDIINDIVNRKTHTDISKEYTFVRPNALAHTEEQIIEVCKELAAGKHIKYIVRKTGMDITAIKNIAAKRVYKEYDFNFRRRGCNEYGVEKIERICNLLETGFSTEEVRGITGIPMNIIVGILNKIIYKSISDKYDLGSRDRITSIKSFLKDK